MADAPRIGFVGAGRMGQCAHLKNYATLAECRVVALAELRAKTARAVADRYGIPNVYGDYHEMLGRESLDAIVAAQPFYRHGILLPDLLATGLPVFCEKPLAGSAHVGRRIAEAARDGASWLMVGYHKRSDPATMAARTEIDRLRQTGELGRMTYVRILMPPGDWVAGGFTDLIDAGDPAPELAVDPPPPNLDPEQHEATLRFVNYYIHQVNLMRHLLGEPYEVVHADPAGVLLIGRSASGLPCTIEMGPYRTTRDWQESALVCFEKGCVRLDLPAPLVTHQPGRLELLRDPRDGAEPETVRPLLPPVHAMRQQAANFIRAVKGEIAPLCGADEALEDLEVAEQYMGLLWRAREEGGDGCR
jgi:predicted dehydrogenase